MSKRPVIFASGLALDEPCVSAVRRVLKHPPVVRWGASWLVHGVDTAEALLLLYDAVPAPRPAPGTQATVVTVGEFTREILHDADVLVIGPLTSRRDRRTLRRFGWWMGTDVKVIDLQGEDGQ